MEEAVFIAYGFGAALGIAFVSYAISSVKSLIESVV
jgi:hypothetical protein